MTYSVPSSRRAFTLIETVVVVAISAAMIVAISLVIYIFNSAVSYQQTSASSANSANLVVREVASLTLPADEILASHAFASGTYMSSSTALVLEIPSLDNSGNVIANTYDYAAFYITGTDVYRLLEADASSRRTSGTKRLSSTVSALTFSYDNADYAQATTVTVDVQTLASVRQGTLTDRLREQLRLRNY